MKKAISRVIIPLLYKKSMHLNNGSKWHHLERFNEACLVVNLGYAPLQAEGKTSSVATGSARKCFLQLQKVLCFI